MSEKWQPKVGDTVWFEPKRMRKGLKQPKVRVLVLSLHKSGTVGVRHTGIRVRAVNPENLSPIE